MPPIYMQSTLQPVLLCSISPTFHLQLLSQNQYSAAYCTENVAGELAHVFGGDPPAVLSLYTV